MKHDKLLKVLYVEDMSAAVSGVRDFLGVYNWYEFNHVPTIEAASMFLRDTLPDILLLDLEIDRKVKPSLELLANVRNDHPQTKVVIFSARNVLSSSTVEAALRHGVSYLVKEEIENEIEMDRALQIAYSGDLVFSRGTVLYIQKLLEPEESLLTPRELEVAALICRGKSNRQIGVELAIAETTARDTVGAIFRKLGCSARSEIAAWYVENYGPCR